jgi:antitoxin MazE
MKTVFRKVGNSRGVLIPSVFLTECKIGAEVEMWQEGLALVIKPVEIVTPRKGWFDNYQAEADVDSWGELSATPVESEDWQW